MAGGATPKPRRSVEVKIPLPAAGHQTVHLVTLNLRVTKGTRTLKVGTLNDARLPSGIRAVAAAVIPKTSRTRRVTDKIYVLINNLPTTPRRTLAQDEDGELDFRAIVSGFVILALHDQVVSNDCTSLNRVGAAADGGVDVFGSVYRFALAFLRPSYEQQSHPEAVLDHVIYGLCQDKGAEVPEEGSG